MWGGGGQIKKLGNRQLGFGRSEQLSLKTLFHSKIRCMRKACVENKRRRKEENNGGNSCPLTSLPVDSLNGD